MKKIDPPVTMRYFKVLGGDLGRALRAQLQNQKMYIEVLEVFARAIGASNVHTHQDTGRFAGFSGFSRPVADPSIWLKNSSGYLIPSRSKQPDFWKALDACDGGNSPADVLVQFGLDPRKWVSYADQDFGCSITGFYSVDLWWVIVPSRHFDQEVVKKAQETGNPADALRMLWVPPMDWEEVTEGKYLNEWDAQYRLEKQL